VARGFASAMILLAALAPAAGYAQVNIDQGKAPGQMYDSDCAACHKSIRGLANGRGASALASFLTEHYTSSAKQAAALAAYVLANGGGVGTPGAATRTPRTKPEPATASAEEPKDRNVKRLPKPEPDQAAGPGSQRPPGTGQKPDGAQTAVAEPGPASPERKPAPGRREPNAGTRARGQPSPADAPRAAPNPTVAAAPNLPTVAGPTTSAAAPGPSGAQAGGDQSGGDAPVPRDNIPD
jgi:hypothetical protein